MNEDVVFINEKMITIDDAEIDKMIGKSLESDNHKFRYCFHENEKSMMQEMLFVIRKDAESRVHKHVENAETQILIRGEAELLIYDDNGMITEKHIVSSKGKFLWRIGKNMYHKLSPITDEIVVYEVREGQFNPSTNTFPAWE